MKNLFTLLAFIAVTLTAASQGSLVRFDDFDAGVRTSLSQDNIYNVKALTDSTSKIMYVGFNGKSKTLSVELTPSAIIDSVNIDSTEGSKRGTGAFMSLFFANDSANVFNVSHIVSVRNSGSVSFMWYNPRNTPYEKVTLDFDVDSLETLLTP